MSLQVWGQRIRGNQSESLAGGYLGASAASASAAVPLGIREQRVRGNQSLAGAYRSGEQVTGKGMKGLGMQSQGNPEWEGLPGGTLEGQGSLASLDPEGARPPCRELVCLCEAPPSYRGAAALCKPPPPPSPALCRAPTTDCPAWGTGPSSAEGCRPKPVLQAESAYL